MDMSMIRERMQELDMDLATLNRRYCDIRRAKGDDSATPVNRRNMLAKAISNDGNPTLETFLDIIAALDGEIFVEWKDTKVKRFSKSA
jgi:DNA-binding phage protein